MANFPYAIPGDTAMWTLPKRAGGFKMRGHSRAGERTGFMMTDVGICFDAGMSCWAVPRCILISHSHTDHSFALPMMVTAQPKKAKVFAPPEAVPFLSRHVLVTAQLNACSTELQEVDSCDFQAVDVGETVNLSAKGRRLTATAVKCPHRVPSIGYCINEKKDKLLEQFKDLTGPEIGAKRKAGEVITEEISEKKMAFMGDTTIELFDLHPELLQYPLIFIECTFWTEGLQESAHKRGHIHWDSLKPFVLGNPDTIFVLIHFTLRFSERDIEEFFTKEAGAEGIKNLALWLDSGVVQFFD